VGFGAWAIGGAWGPTDDDESLAAMHAAVDAGVTFFETADVYGDGRSERLIGRLLDERREPLVVATKFGRRAPLDISHYTYENLRAWLERSRENLGVDVIDLVQLHCPPWEVYYEPAVFEACDRLVADGLVRAYGVSVEKVEQGLKAIEYPGVATVQIIFNSFRQRPAGLFFEQARHRDVGETFAGVDLDRGLEVVDALRPLVPDGMTMGQLALRWILDFEAVTTVIPGAKTPEQARANAAAAELPPLPPEAHARIADVYGKRIAPFVHQRW